MKEPHCQHCKTTEGELFVNSRHPNGRVSYMCSPCNTERCKKYRKTDHGKASIYKAVRKSTVKLMYKQRARQIVYEAIRHGKLKKPSKCTHCLEKKRLEGHHEDYAKPLEVIWLCKKCHTIHHKNNKI